MASKTKVKVLIQDKPSPTIEALRATITARCERLLATAR